jgi:hypothetical protein
MIKPGQNIGQRVGGEPDRVLDHFYTCKACGQLVDKRDLGQVFHHEVRGNKRLSGKLTLRRSQ